MAKCLSLSFIFSVCNCDWRRQLIWSTLSFLVWCLKGFARSEVCLSVKKSSIKSIKKPLTKHKFSEEKHLLGRLFCQLCLKMLMFLKRKRPRLSQPLKRPAQSQRKTPILSCRMKKERKYEKNGEKPPVHPNKNFDKRSSRCCLLILPMNELIPGEGGGSDIAVNKEGVSLAPCDTPQWLRDDKHPWNGNKGEKWSFLFGYCVKGFENLGLSGEWGSLFLASFLWNGPLFL